MNIKIPLYSSELSTPDLAKYLHIREGLFKEQLFWDKEELRYYCWVPREDLAFPLISGRVKLVGNKLEYNKEELEKFKNECTRQA